MKEIKDGNNLVETKGITLIALVITIIVLLILAGITIASLTGNNGLLARAVAAKEETEKAGAKEQIGTEVLASYNTIGKLDETMLATNLKHVAGLTYEDGSAIGDKVELPTTVKLNGNLYNIYGEGRIEAEETHIYSDETKAKLTEGKYVTYQGKPYIVLYDVNSGYGWIEIISESPLKTVSLGYADTKVKTSDFPYTGSGTMNDNARKAAASYNRLITTLHEEAQEYLSNLADRARCVGSDPKYPTNDVVSTTYTNEYSYMETYSWNNRFKVADINYTRGDDTSKPKRDKDQMDGLDIAKYTDNTYYAYWLASRDVNADSSDTYFYVPLLINNSNVYNFYLCRLRSNGISSSFKPSYGFRPVIRLKSGVKVSNPTAAGTADDPYELEI